MTFAAAVVFFFSFDAPWTLRGDNKAVFYPMTLAAYRAWAGGHPPEWSNGLWAGYPLLADPSSGSMYWPTFPFFLVTPEPHVRAYDLSTAFHAGLLVAGSAHLLLMLGVSPTVAVFGGGLTLLAPLIQYWAAAWLPVYGALSWWPWLFAAAEALAQTASRHTRSHLLVGWVALATGAAAFPEYSLYAGVVALCWVLTRSGSLSFQQRFWRAMWLGAGGVALAAPQVIPSALYQAESFRGAPIPTHLASLVSLRADLPSLVLPWQAAEHRLFLFVGPTALLLVALAIVRRQPRAVFLSLVGLIALLIAVGDQTPLYGLVHGLPILNRLRNPFKLGPLLEVAMAWSAALGADALWRKPRRPSVILAGALMATVMAERLAYSIWAHLPDSRATDFSALHQRLTESGLLTHALRHELPPPRVLETVDLHNLTMLYGLEALTGGGVALGPRKHVLALWPRFYGPVAKAGKSPTRAELDLYGVHLLVTKGPWCGRQAVWRGGLQLLKATQQTCLFANPSRPPRYAFMDRVRAAATLDEMIDLVKADPSGPIPVVAPAGEIEPYLASPGADRVEVTAYRAGDVRLSVTTLTARLLLVRESLVTGWRVRIDDQPAPLYPAAAIFFAVPVPAGQHEVRLEYRAPGFRAGCLMAGLWIVGTSAVWVRRGGSGKDYRNEPPHSPSRQADEARTPTGPDGGRAGDFDETG